MPEGPEIHRAADRIAKAVAGRRATEVFFAFDELKKHQKALSGRTVLTVEPRGKAILTRFEGGLNIYSHNQLYGRWMIRRAGNMPDTNRQLRVAIHNDKKSALLYSASEIEVLTDDELHQQPYLARLGPDPLRDEISPDDVLRRYQNEDFHRRQLAGLLLDQGFVAGVGNYLRSEILFEASVWPRAKLRDLEPDTIERLAQATCILMKRAYETRGITNTPERVAALKEAGKKRREYRHFVFGRSNRPCFLCSDTVEREEVANRRLFYCPRCQRKGR